MNALSNFIELLTTMTQSPSRFDFFVGVLSSPTNHRLRKVWREKCAPKYRAAGIRYRFFIGRISMDKTEYVTNVLGALERGKGEFQSLLELSEQIGFIHDPFDFYENS